MGKFAVQWTNNATNNRAMSTHHVDLTAVQRTHQGERGLSCKKLFLDQMYVMFRPTSDINAGEFVAPDTNQFNFRAETTQMLVRIDKGFQYPLLAVPATTSTAKTSGIKTNIPLTYSTAMTVTPEIDGNEDYWCRTYRPVRDLPVAINVENWGDLKIDLLFPVLIDNPIMQQVPDYRILRVLCEFSTTDD